MYVLEHLKETGVPCSRISLYRPKPKFTTDPKSRIGVPIHLNQPLEKQVMKVFKKSKRFYLKINLGKDEFYLRNNTVKTNQRIINYLEDTIKLDHSEYTTNYKRWKVLGEILGDDQS